MFKICALYKFVSLDRLDNLRILLYDLLQKSEVKGTILLASEGINGTIAGSAEAIKKVLDYLQKDSRFLGLECKFSASKKPPFKRLKVKIKKEIVTMGVADIDPKFAGIYVSAKNWDNLIADNEVILIDTRNNYEHQIGSFRGAINPNTESFREFPEFVKNNLMSHKNKKIAMFCTGGIRCEKSTAYLKSQGFKKVYHLKGGVLKYLEGRAEKSSSWDGECFVFDDRVAVSHNLSEGQYDQCHACRYPLTEAEKLDEKYEKGVSCPRCFGSKNDTQIGRYRERQKQMVLAAKRGEAHIGDDVKLTKRKI